MLSEFLASLRARLLNSSSLAQETVRDGQTLLNGFFQNTVVDTTPAFLLDNNFARFLNFGQVETNNAVAAVQVSGEDAQVFNFRTGSIEANSGNVLATGVQVTGSAAIRNFGEISGDFNGVQFAGAGSSGILDNFRGGVISSDSRAVDIQGDGVSVRNFGDIVGTDDQRNGTIYTNSTAENVSISNFAGGTIDAGEGNTGAGISLQVGDEIDDVVANTVFNGAGATIEGRGQNASNTPGAGDGIRLNNGADGAVSDTDIVNSGLITTDSNQGTAAGIRIADGLSAEGRILNTSTGTIEGARNGLYFGQGEHDLDVLNFGTIQSGSRAVNIDGTGVDLLNAGDILGTDDQRNGTVYADGTADDFSVRNLANGTIDAGVGNQGSGFGAEIGDAEDGANTFALENDGLIQGRGNASAGSALAGDGVRIGNVGNQGTSEATITNRGEILSEGANGTVAGVRVVNGIDFKGELINDGLIAGEQNGVYFGTGDHTGGRFVNSGTVTSGSRAVNIDGDGLEVVNEGQILGTGDQRNGTVYADGTADNYTFTNTGTVDTGIGNNGSAVSLQTGDFDGDVVSAAVFNEGTFQGRGDATEGNQIGDGLRLFSNQEDASFAGLVQNEGLIAGSEDSDAAAGIRVDGGLNILGAIINEGEIRGNTTAIDATDAGSVTFVNDDDGIVNGDVLLGAGDDIVVDLGQINGVVNGGAGDDVLLAGDGDNVLVGGLGNDFLEGGDGIDTADFSDLDVAVTVSLDENGNGTATRDTGFTLRVDSAPVVAPGQFGSAIENGAQFIEQAVAGNLYYNIHTSDFPGGEIRGQFEVISDVGDNHGRVIELVATLDAAQEPGPLSDSDATGTATLTISFDEATGEVVYSSELAVVGLNEADLQSPIPGVVSPIHLHNAPAGANGPVVQDAIVDAGTGLDVIDDFVAGNEEGFEVQVNNVLVEDPGQFGAIPEDGDDFINEAINGNLYYNIHTADFPGGEIRGQLFLDNDFSEVVDGVEFDVFELSGGLDASQEPGPLSDSNATGQATLTIRQNTETGEVTYSSTLSVLGIGQGDLQTPAGGILSAIHLHNAPAGQNGPVVQDTLVDAGGTLDVEDPIDPTGIVINDVLENTIETDVLSSIERVVGSDDSDTIDLSSLNGVTIDLDLSGPAANPAAQGGEGPQDGAIIVDGAILTEVDDFENVVGSSGDDLILGNDEFNILDGGAGNDAIHSFGGADIIIGGEGSDTALFTAGPGVVLDLDEFGNGVAEVNAPDGATLDQVFGFENINGSNNAGSPNGGNDILSGNSGENVLRGQAGDDILNGEGGDDVLEGGAGNDILIGGEGADIFTFGPGFGTDVILDFQIGLDRLDFSDFGPDFASSVSVTQEGRDAVFSFGSEGGLRLEGVDSALLNDDDFIS